MSKSNNPFRHINKPLRGRNQSEESKTLHNRDDVDADAQAHHHTLGKGATQASPGNHTHVIWNTGDVIYTYGTADDEEWFELNGQVSPTPALVDLFGANLPTVSTGITDLIALVHT